MYTLIKVKFFAVLSTAFVGVILICLLFLAYGFPEPYIHDEFAYLLGADTFLEGRLTNPTPPMSEFFETFHVNMTPTYHSKYPPGQSAFLALGKLIFGREIYGVWLSYVLAAVAVTWALFAAFSPRWALLGGVLAIVNSTLLLRWAYSFWGGSVAMLGGALLMGGLLRICHRPCFSGAAWTSVGLFILAFSRPLEGLLTSGILLLLYVNSLIKPGPDFSELRKGLKIYAVLFLAGCLILGLNLVYNKTLTGSVLTFPHMKWTAADSVHELVRAYQGSEPNTLLYKYTRFFLVFMGPILWIPTLLTFRHLRDLRILSALFTILFLAIYSTTTSRAWPHYIAPVMPLAIGLQLAGCRMLHRWIIGSTRIGFILLSVLLTLHFGYHLKSFAEQSDRINFQASRERGAVFKRDVDRFLEEQTGNHLIFVRHMEGHTIHWEYVYNRADIPSAKVIWAREMSVEANRRLVDSYPDRKIWLLMLENFTVDLRLVREPEK